MKTKYTKELLSSVVARNISISGVLTDLGLKVVGGNHSHIQSRIRYFCIDTSHFKGQGWSKNQTSLTNKSVAQRSSKIRYTFEEIMVENSKTTSSELIKKHMLQKGIIYRCYNDHEPFWMDQPLTLHIDHINGIHNDNRLENLRFLCPNCHQQTKTWGNRH